MLKFYEPFPERLNKCAYIEDSEGNRLYNTNFIGGGKDLMVYDLAEMYKKIISNGKTEVLAYA